MEAFKRIGTVTKNDDDAILIVPKEWAEAKRPNTPMYDFRLNCYTVNIRQGIKWLFEHDMMVPDHEHCLPLEFEDYILHFPIMGYILRHGRGEILDKLDLTGMALYPALQAKQKQKKIDWSEDEPISTGIFEMIENKSIGF